MTRRPSLALGAFAALAIGNGTPAKAQDAAPACQTTPAQIVAVLRTNETRLISTQADNIQGPAASITVQGTSVTVSPAIARALAQAAEQEIKTASGAACAQALVTQDVAARAATALSIPAP